VQVPAGRLVPFDPVGLGGAYPRWRAVLTDIANDCQSRIAERLRAELDDLDDPGDDNAEALALRVVVLALTEYLAAGYYPLVSGGRCFLAPVFEADALPPEGRARALRQVYEFSRDRALRDRDDGAWLGRLAGALADSDYDPAPLVDVLRHGPPEIELVRATASKRPLDERGLWRAVRATWSMTPEASAPGREVAFIAHDRRHPRVPLAIVQLRNVVPEIRARDEWLGIAPGSPGCDGRPGTGYIGLLEAVAPGEARDRAVATRDLLDRLLAHVNTDGLGVTAPRHGDLEPLLELRRSRHARFHADRRRGADGAGEHLAVVKRADTAMHLLRGMDALEALARDPEPAAAAAAAGPALLRDLEVGLRKLWHYHMGFVAIELSICGAAPPFGMMRAGKLAAAVAAGREVLAAWGTRPLGLIAQQTYLPTVRDALPDPGPLLMFTSGLYPGHSAQYNRVQVAGRPWRRIGSTVGWGAFHVSVQTAEAMDAFNRAADGYQHITRAFGEGSGARFRTVGKALGRLGLPDLRRHETRRPLYALELADNPRGALLGWAKPRPAPAPTAAEVAGQWWARWVAPRADEFADRAADAEDLAGAVRRLAGEARRL